MCNLSQGIEKGRALGRGEGSLLAIADMVTSLKLSLEEVIVAKGIPEYELEQMLSLGQMIKDKTFLKGFAIGFVEGFMEIKYENPKLLAKDTYSDLNTFL